MRKVLLATSALVAGSAFATAANAAAPEMTIFGSLDVQYQGESYDDKTAAGAKPGNTDQLGFLNFMNSIHFDINAEADNGLAYGGRVDWRPSNNSIDEIWIDMSGSFGTIVLGNDDAPGENNTPNAGSVLVGSFGWTGTYVAGTGSKVGAAPSGATPTGATSDNTKVAYYTPDFGGFGAGVAFSPDTNAASTSYDSITEVGAWWSGDVSGAALTVGAQYLMGDNEVSTAEDLASWEIGGTLGVAGFNFGASYFDNGDSNQTIGSKADAGSGFTFGVGYSMGATSVSVGYLTSTADDSTGKEDTYSNLALDIEHSVAEGLLVYGGVQFADSEDGSVSGNGSSQSSTSLVLGTRLSF